MLTYTGKEKALVYDLLMACKKSEDLTDKYTNVFQRSDHLLCMFGPSYRDIRKRVLRSCFLQLTPAAYNSPTGDNRCAVVVSAAYAKLTPVEIRQAVLCHYPKQVGVEGHTCWLHLVEERVARYTGQGDFCLKEARSVLQTLPGKGAKGLDSVLKHYNSWVAAYPTVDAAVGSLTQF